MDAPDTEMSRSVALHLVKVAQLAERYEGARSNIEVLIFSSKDAPH